MTDDKRPHEGLDALLDENRTFEPPEGFADRAVACDEDLVYGHSVRNSVATITRYVMRLKRWRSRDMSS